MLTKPPIGVPPHWFVYRRRMEDLNAAIGRYLNYAEETQHIAKKQQIFEAIAGWAKELETLALLESELEEMNDTKRPF